MFTTATFLARFRPGLHWVRARLATLSVPGVLARVIAIEPCRLPMPVPIPTPVPRRLSRVAALSGVLAMSAVLAALPEVARASHRGDFEFTADGRLVDVQVQVEGKGAVPLYVAPGRFDRRYFQAFKGRNYSLVVRNTTGRRVGVLIAVDGLNVVDGNRSSFSRHESMYVLDPHERAVIRGWRTSLDQVRRFVFVDEERSYAERTGQANGDMGWIRVLAFREQRPFWDRYGKIRGREGDDEVAPYGTAPEQEREDGAAPERRELQKSAPRAQSNETAPGAPGDAQLYGQRDDASESSPGTGWGQKQWDRVNRTRFVAEHSPVDRFALRYEYVSGLRALGIRIWRGQDRLWERERGELGFAQPPQW